MGGYHTSAVGRIGGLGTGLAWGIPLACLSPQAWRHYLYDGLGSTRQLLDASQNVTDTYTYEAFGNLKGSTGSTPNPYRYVGSLGYYQTGSSLMHLGARYYWPEVGRFGQRDPVGENHSGSYAYSIPNPVLYADATGLLAQLVPVTSPPRSVGKPRTCTPHGIANPRFWCQAGGTIVVGGVVIVFGGGPFVVLIGCTAGYAIGDEIWYHCVDNGFWYHQLTAPQGPCDDYDGIFGGRPWPIMY